MFTFSITSFGRVKVPWIQQYVSITPLGISFCKRNVHYIGEVVQSWRKSYIHKTINRVSKKLAQWNNDAGGKQDEHGDPAVKPEHKIVNPYLT